jgi:DNA topoisomerase-6 subunit B
MKTRQQSDRREVFLRYLKEVASAVSVINAAEQRELYDRLVDVAKKHTSDADVKMDDLGRKVTDDPTQLDLGENVLIVDPAHHQAAINRVVTAPASAAAGGDDEE